MNNNKYLDEASSFLTTTVESVDYKLTTPVELDPTPEHAKYDALLLSIALNSTTELKHYKIVYRKGKVTPDRPGAFLSLWQRPTSTANGNKPVPLTVDNLDYLFIRVHAQPTLNEKDKTLPNMQSGLFIFPTSVLVEKGIVTSAKYQGKTGFRVFPPWCQNRGERGTKVFSASGKKTQRWQQPYFLTVTQDGSIDTQKLAQLLSQ